MTHRVVEAVLEALAGPVAGGGAVSARSRLAPVAAGSRAAPRPRVVLSANTSWNIVNFRSGLVAGLIADGYDVVVVAPQDQHSDRLAALGCRHVALAMDNKGANPLRDLALLARYYRILRRECPMAYLGYTIKPNVYGSLAAHMLSIPVINNVSGLGTAFIRNTWLTTVVKGLYRTALGRSATVFFQNEDDRGLFVDLGLVDRRRSDVLPGSGIDTRKYRPRIPSVDGARPRRFLLVARLLWDKGVGEYVEAARRVRAKVPDATFSILGFLDVENRTAVSRSDVEEWQREGVISYLGPTQDVRPFIAEADCVVLPSYREGTARTLLEAAAMGKPLIASDVPGCRNVVEHGSNGFLCRVRDAEDLAVQMLAFLSLSRERIDDLGRRSRAKVEQEFDEGLVVARYLDVLGRIGTRPTVATAADANGIAERV